ncbi:MAG: 2-phosphosulfolactate phosphatase, partial [Lachnospiraceae bacterium]|nr:2-phosphosulfolactate phosphatase [Candidatus Equihabitans merdae]
VIDVFRAFSLEAYMMAAGADKILAVGAEETARRLKAEHPEYVLAGERHGVILPGFDLGNSPWQARELDLMGKTVVHTTSAGTQGLVAASRGADQILTGALVNAKAIASYIAGKNPENVSICCMGVEGLEEAPEDELCGRYLNYLLNVGNASASQTFDMDSELEVLRHTGEGAKFFEAETQHIFPERDYWMSTQVDRFDFVLEARQIAEDIFEVKKL